MIGVVVNPHAGGRAGDRRLAARLRDLVGGDGAVVETHALDEVPAAVADLATRGVDTVATCGGDGTNLSVLTAMGGSFPAGAWPRILMLRGGTVNTSAANLGITGRPLEILARYLRRRRAGRPLPTLTRELLTVDEHHGFLWGAGMAGRFFEAYDGGPVTGLPWAGLLGLRIFASALVGGDFARWIFAPLAAEVEVDGQVLPHDRFSLILAGAVPNDGLGFRATYRAGTVPGRFHLVATGLSAGRLAWNTPRMLAGRPVRGTPHFDRLAREVRVRFAAPQCQVLDGDRRRGAEVRLRSGPAVTFVVP
jgi:diacylglycerol kinase family enzyme